MHLRATHGSPLLHRAKSAGSLPSFASAASQLTSSSGSNQFTFPDTPAAARNVRSNTKATPLTPPSPSSTAYTVANPINMLLFGIAIGTNLVATMGGERLPWDVKAFVKTTMTTIMTLLALRARLFVIAAAFLFSALGDWFLVSDFRTYFMHGMVSFLVGRGFFVWGFWQLRPANRYERFGFWHRACELLSTLVLVGLVGDLWPRIDDMGLKIPLVVYALAMWGSNVVAARLGQSPLIPFGSLSFFVSDAVIAWQAFGDEAIWGGTSVDPFIWGTYSLAMQGIGTGVIVESLRTTTKELVFNGDADAERLDQQLDELIAAVKRAKGNKKLNEVIAKVDHVVETIRDKKNSKLDALIELKNEKLALFRARLEGFSNSDNDGDGISPKKYQ